MGVKVEHSLHCSCQSCADARAVQRTIATGAEMAHEDGYRWLVETWENPHDPRALQELVAGAAQQAQALAGPCYDIPGYKPGAVVDGILQALAQVRSPLWPLARMLHHAHRAMITRLVDLKPSSLLWVRARYAESTHWDVPGADTDRHYEAEPDLHIYHVWDDDIDVCGWVVERVITDTHVTGSFWLATGLNSPQMAFVEAGNILAGEGR